MSILRALAVFTALLAPSAALAKAPPRKPSPGVWKVASAFAQVSSGRFTITPGSAGITGLRLTIGTNASTACGTGTLQFQGTQRLAIATRAGISVWIVGENAPAISDGIATVPVTALRAGKKVSGQLKLAFQTATFGGGQLELGKKCTVVFSIKK